MAKNNPHSVDRSYKYLYKTLKIKFHRYLFHEGENIEFLETEIAETGQLKDLVVKVDDHLIRIIELMAKPLYDPKLIDIFDYVIYTLYDPQYEDCKVTATGISIANPHHGKNAVTISDNIDFHLEIIFIKEKDGQKVLSTIIQKVLLNEELSDDDAIELLLLPDMDIEVPIKTLMKTICYLIGLANIPDDDFKRRIIACERIILARFFKGDEFTEMVNLLKTETKYENIDSEFGEVFEARYYDGITDGMAKGILQVAENLLKNGFDDKIVSINTGIPLVEVKNIKRRL